MPESPKALPPCEHCEGRRGVKFENGLTMAFQPIFDAMTGEIYAHEALVRTPDGGSAEEVLSTVTALNRYSFDQRCRIKAVQLASELGLNTRLTINCTPNAVLDPINCMRTTIIAARRCKFPVHNIIFEMTERECVDNIDRLRQIINGYRHTGFRVAFDDFGAGHSGLGLLADLQPDLIKLDMRLIRGIDTDRVRASIVDACLSLCMDLEIEVIVEGVETEAEFGHLVGAGARLFQGYLLGRPLLEGLVHQSSVRLPLAA